MDNTQGHISGGLTTVGNTTVFHGRYSLFHRVNWKYCKNWNFSYNLIIVGFNLDWRQCGNSLALCYFAVVMELPDSL